MKYLFQFSPLRPAENTRWMWENEPLSGEQVSLGEERETPKKDTQSELYALNDELLQTTIKNSPANVPFSAEQQDVYLKRLANETLEPDLVEALLLRLEPTKVLWSIQTNHQLARKLFTKNSQEPLDFSRLERPGLKVYAERLRLETFFSQDLLPGTVVVIDGREAFFTGVDFRALEDGANYYKKTLRTGQREIVTGQTKSVRIKTENNQPVVLSNQARAQALEESENFYLQRIKALMIKQGTMLDFKKSPKTVLARTLETDNLSAHQRNIVEDYLIVSEINFSVRQAENVRQKIRKIRHNIQLRTQLKFIVEEALSTKESEKAVEAFVKTLDKIDVTLAEASYIGKLNTARKILVSKHAPLSAVNEKIVSSLAEFKERFQKKLKEKLTRDLDTLISRKKTIITNELSGALPKEAIQGILKPLTVEKLASLLVDVSNQEPQKNKPLHILKLIKNAGLEKFISPQELGELAEKDLLGDIQLESLIVYEKLTNTSQELYEIIDKTDHIVLKKADELYERVKTGSDSSFLLDLENSPYEKEVIEIVIKRLKLEDKENLIIKEYKEKVTSYQSALKIIRESEELSSDTHHFYDDNVSKPKEIIQNPINSKVYFNSQSPRKEIPHQILVEDFKNTPIIFDPKLNRIYPANISTEYIQIFSLPATKENLTAMQFYSAALNSSVDKHIDSFAIMLRGTEDMNRQIFWRNLLCPNAGRALHATEINGIQNLENTYGIKSLFTQLGLIDSQGKMDPSRATKIRVDFSELLSDFGAQSSKESIDKSLDKINKKYLK